MYMEKVKSYKMSLLDIVNKYLNIINEYKKLIS